MFRYVLPLVLLSFSFVKSKAHIQLTEIHCTTTQFANPLANSFMELTNEDASVFHSCYPTQTDSANFEKYRRKARSANKLGIAGLVILTIPVINLLSLPASILAIVFGSRAKKHLAENDPAKNAARKAVIAGIVTLALFSLVLYILLRLF